jgi:hypothetical protein
MFIYLFIRSDEIIRPTCTGDVRFVKPPRVLDSLADKTVKKLWERVQIVHFNG